MILSQPFLDALVATIFLLSVWAVALTFCYLAEKQQQRKNKKKNE